MTAEYIDQLLSVAEIASVFIGFVALVSVLAKDDGSLDGSASDAGVGRESSPTSWSARRSGVPLEVGCTAASPPLAWGFDALPEKANHAAPPATARPRERMKSRVPTGGP